MVGKKSILDNTKDKMVEILSTHKVEMPLTDSQEEDIDRILKDARSYYKGKDML
jgi:hypothetical protein